MHALVRAQGGDLIALNVDFMKTEAVAASRHAAEIGGIPYVDFVERFHDEARTLSRWLVFGAALMPWLIGLGFAAALMLVLFSLSDPSTRLK